MPAIEIDFEIFMPNEHVCLNYVELLRQPLLLPKMSESAEIPVRSELF
ncbi:MAG: hypothetical protein ACTSWW_08185 [Promethearchaeota archaeon]